MEAPVESTIYLFSSKSLNVSVDDLHTISLFIFSSLDINSFIKFRSCLFPLQCWQVLVKMCEREREEKIGRNRKQMVKSSINNVLRDHLSTRNTYSEWRMRARPLDCIKLVTVSGKSNRITRQQVWISSPSSATLVATSRFSCYIQQSKQNYTNEL